MITKLALENEILKCKNYQKISKKTLNLKQKQKNAYNHPPIAFKIADN